MFVYLITNLINGKRYVGQTSVSIEQRWRQHRSSAKHGVGCHLHNAIKKYGAENFEIKPLVIVGSKEEMDYYETRLIDVWDLRNPEKGYNLTDGGEGCSGLRHSEKTKAILREKAKQSGSVPPSRKGCKMPPLTAEQLEQRRERARKQIRFPLSGETKKKLSLINTGKILSEEHKRKIALAHVGMKRTPESIKKTRLANLGRKHSLESSLKKSLATKSRSKSEATRRRMKEAWVIRRLRRLATESGRGQ